MNYTGFILHTEKMIISRNLLNKIANNNNYLTHYNKYYLPFLCENVNHDNRIIDGKFNTPIWNTLQRTILSKGTKFPFTYVKGDNYLLEFQPTDLNYYHIYSNYRIHPNSIKTAPNILKNNSILLFSLDKDVADMLIKNQLL